jgi:xanthine dehydrogenase iron-sulfur cluster and FAD-binding subunit A
MLGNLCRCGGYQKIVAAVLQTAADSQAVEETGALQGAASNGRTSVDV